MKKDFTSETAFKIYSVLIAILLWVFVVYNQNPQSTKVIDNIDISYTNEAQLQGAGLTIRKDARKPSVSVTVKGRRLSIGKIDSSNVSAYITVPSIHEGEYDVSVETRLPISDVAIVDKKPYTLKVIVEKLKKASVPVEIKYTGSPKNENSAVDADITPKQITVWGPESVIDNISNAVVTFDVSSAVEGQAINLKYKIYSHDGKDVTANPNINVDVSTISVLPSVYETKDIPIEVKYTGTVADGYAIESVEIFPAQIRLGSKGLGLDVINKIMTEPIDISSLTHNKKTSVKLVVPDEFLNVFSISEAEVSINVVKRISKTVEIRDVSFHNTKEGMMYEVRDLPMYVTLTGAKNALDSLVVNAYVDVADIFPGEHTVPVKLDLPKEITLDEERSVTVVVSSAKDNPTTAE